MSVARKQDVKVVMFVPAAQNKPINVLNDTAKARQKVNASYSCTLFPYVCLSWFGFDSLIIFKMIINFHEFITIYQTQPGCFK